MYFFGRGISAFFNQFFKWLFWNKTGQKLLFSILIVFIFFCFIKLGEVSAVEEVSDINYEVRSYYDSVVNEAILRLYKNWDNVPEGYKNAFLNGENNLYFYYGSNDGMSLANAKPNRNENLNYILLNKSINPSSYTLSNYDFIGVTGYSMYVLPRNVFRIPYVSGNITQVATQLDVTVPLFVFSYTSDNWVRFVDDMKYNKTNDVIELLTEIEADLSNTTPTSETDSFVDVDTSSVDDISSTQVDNVFSSITTSFSNKFISYDLSTVNSFVWDLNGTRITFYSDTLYKMIRGTFFETLLSMLWYYIFGHYAFVWLSNIIHKIKDGSILDGLEVNEVITKEML